LLFYTSPKEEENNIQDKVNITHDMLNLQGESISNCDIYMSSPQGSNIYGL